MEKVGSKLLDSTNGLVNVCSSLRQTLKEVVQLRSDLGTAGATGALLSEQENGKENNEKKIKLRKHTMKATMQIMQLKSANSEIFLGIDEMRKRVRVAKEQTEAEHLNLQNLLYEKAFLLREIRRCRDFTTDETNKIDLLSEEEFLKIGPESLTNVKKGESEHKFQLNRLSHELQLRKELKAELERTKVQKKAVLANTAEKDKFLAGIPKKLKLVEEATLPLQKYLKKPLSRQIQLREECRKLPTALYLIYCQLDAFGSSFGNVKVQVADSKYEEQGEDVETTGNKRKLKEDSKDGSTATKKGRGTPSGSPLPSPSDSPNADSESLAEERLKLLRAQDPYRPHDLAVSARFRSKEDSGKQVDLNLRFQYLPKLDVVTVEPSGMHGLLANLFPNDTGQMLPRAAFIDSTNTTQTKSSRLFPALFAGRPYKWAQWLGGLYHLSAVDPDVSSVPESVEPPTADIVHRILQRVHAQEMLSEQLGALSKCPHPVPVHPEARPLFPQTAASRLVKWEEVSFAEARTAVATSRPPKSPMPVIKLLPYSPTRAGATKSQGTESAQGLLEEAESDGSWKNFGCRCFRGMLKVGAEQVEAIVHVFVDYPSRLPQFTLVKIGADGTRATDNNLKSIQIELNAFASELSVGQAEYLLSHQLRRLQMCLDVMVGDVDATRMFGRPRRGRDRRLALVYDAETKQFVHR